jgi:putative flippase GtrA
VLAHTRLSGQVVRFAAVGVASTLAYLGLYVLLRNWMPATWANLLALLATTIANTATNRRLTFGVKGGHAMARHQLQALLVFAIALGLSDGSLALLSKLDPTPGRLIEVGALVVANVLSTALRFVLLRLWVFRTPEGDAAPPVTLSPE